MFVVIISTIEVMKAIYITDEKIEKTNKKERKYMKKLLFAAHSLGLGGIETALVTLLEELVKKEYDITLILEKKEGIFLDTLNSNIKVEEYCPSNNRFIFLRKIINMCKQIKFKIKYKNKFDFAAAYATYSLSNGFVARAASKNSALWVHLDYLTLNNNDEEKTKQYYKKLKCEEFKNIIFVSNESKNNFLKLFPECKNKAIYCNNLIDGKKIIEKSKEDIPEKKENIITFLNVGRHDEKQKRLTRLIEVADMLKNDKLEFRILLIGDGKDTDQYKKIIKEKNLQDKIFLLGRKKNPYPYYKISDCVILTSDYEGYPVVFLESMILKIPIITTNVSDYKEVEGKFGIVTTKDINEIYNAMKKFITDKYHIKQEFDYKKYNEEIIQKLEKILNK